MASSFPSAAPTGDGARAAAAWHQEEQPPLRTARTDGDDSPQLHDSDSGEANEHGGPTEGLHTSPVGTDASSLSHSNAEISLRQVETCSEGGSCAASEDAQQCGEDTPQGPRQRHARENDGDEAAERPQLADAIKNDRGQGQDEVIMLEPHAQRSPSRLPRGSENIPAQGRDLLPAGAKRPGQNGAGSAAHKLDFESVRPSPIAPLGKAAAANWLRSHR